MSTLISSSRLARRPMPGITQQMNFTAAKIDEPELLIIEPSFKEFASATPGQLSAPAHIASLVSPDSTERVCVLVSYSRANAKSFKGWLNDVVQAFKGRGYVELSSLHIPFESYGVPMVGSVLALLFGATRPALQLVKSVTYPAQQFPGMVYHSPSGRAKGGVYPGTAGLNGFLNSATSFLPDLSLWDVDCLRAEYRAGESLTSEQLRVENIRELFGCEGWQTMRDLHLATPPLLLAQITQHFRLIA